MRTLKTLAVALAATTILFAFAGPATNAQKANAQKANAQEANAQNLATGIWTGTVEPPNGQYIDLTYNVRMESDSLKIRLIVPNMGEVEATDIRMEGDNLLFNWFPGALLTCELKPRDDGKYRGTCVDPGGDPGYLTMVPPGAGDEDDG